MSKNFVEASKQAPCPICGKADWCCKTPSDDGYGMLYLCKKGIKRQKIKADVLSQYDGEYYIYMGESENSFCYRKASDLYAAGKNVKRGEFQSDLTSFEFKEKEIRDVSKELPHKKLDEVYRLILSQYKLESWHRDYLLGEGWDDAMIAKYHIVSLPENDYVRWKKKEAFKNNKMLSPRISFQPSRRKVLEEVIKRCGYEPEGVPGVFYKTTSKDSYWTLNGHSGILFPIFDSDGYIYRLRVRLDYEDLADEIKVDGNGRYYEKENENGHLTRYYISMSGVKFINLDMEYEKVKMAKYNNISSFKSIEEGSLGYKEDFITNYYKKGCSSGNQIGLYVNNDTNYYFAQVCEGEKKAIMATEKMKVPSIVIPGVQSINKISDGTGKEILDTLKEKGVKFLAIMFDMDKYSNPDVANAEKQAVELALKQGFDCLIGEWDEKYKGLDDALNGKTKIDYVLASSVYPEIYSRFKK